MKITEIKKLAIPEVQVISYKRFMDHRGYFTEHYRKSDLLNNSSIESLRGENFVQANESFSFKNTIFFSYINCKSGFKELFHFNTYKN